MKVPATTTTQKRKLSIKNFLSKYDQVTVTVEILNGKLHFLCSVFFSTFPFYLTFLAYGSSVLPSIV